MAASRVPSLSVLDGPATGVVLMILTLLGVRVLGLALRALRALRAPAGAGS